MIMIPSVLSAMWAKKMLNMKFVNKAPVSTKPSFKVAVIKCRLQYMNAGDM